MKRVALLIILALGLAIFAGYGTFQVQNKADERALAALGAEEVLIASTDIKKGTTLQNAYSSGRIAKLEFPKKFITTHVLRSITVDLQGQVALIDIKKGQLLYSNQFGIKIPSKEILQVAPGQSAISVNLPAESRVGGFLKPGDYVRVFSISNNVGNQLPVKSKVLFQKVLVLAVGGQAMNDVQITEMGVALENVVTLSIPTNEASKILDSVKNSTLSLLLLAKQSPSVAKP